MAGKSYSSSAVIRYFGGDDSDGLADAFCSGSDDDLSLELGSEYDSGKKV